MLGNGRPWRSIYPGMGMIDITHAGSEALREGSCIAVCISRGQVLGTARVNTNRFRRHDNMQIATSPLAERVIHRRKHEQHQTATRISQNRTTDLLSPLISDDGSSRAELGSYCQPGVREYVLDVEGLATHVVDETVVRERPEYSGSKAIPSRLEVVDEPTGKYRAECINVWECGSFDGLP